MGYVVIAVVPNLCGLAAWLVGGEGNWATWVADRHTHSALAWLACIHAQLDLHARWTSVPTQLTQVELHAFRPAACMTQFRIGHGPEVGDPCIKVIQPLSHILNWCWSFRGYNMNGRKCLQGLSVWSLSHRRKFCLCLLCEWISDTWNSVLVKRFPFLISLPK